jgi:hypothetical protein
MSERILYCHCAFAKVVPADVKLAVLNGLSEADVEFDAVPDLCEMAAHQQDELQALAAGAPLRIAACYPRAVKWLFASANAPLADDAVRIWNMRTEQPAAVIEGLLAQTFVGRDRGAAPAGSAPDAVDVREAPGTQEAMS